MDWTHLEQYKPHAAFRIVERDLAQDAAMRKKLFFTEEDAQVDHTNARLEKGEIEIPVFKETTIRPLGFGGKYLGYQVENFGAGFYKITQKHGKIRPKPNDHRFPLEETQKTVFYIGYDHETRAYQFFKGEKKFQQAYAEIQQLKQSPQIQEIVNDFIDWIQWFWTPAFKKAFHLEWDSTLEHYLNLIEHVKDKFPLIRSYSLLLNLWGDICETAYLLTLKSLEALERRLEAVESELQQESNLLQLVNHSAYERTIVDMHLHIQRVLVDRGYFVQDGCAYPNLSEQFRREQFSEIHESDETYQARVDELLSQTRAAYFMFTPGVK